ncbi:MAG: NAD-dependent epimerase/dehydratase family protein [Novosphingobium sp.]|nr:NAD-dependent epimerase/dehydratase family protein [Novosphingobium sp.]
MAGTVLVTGGSGYIGGELIRQLLDRGWTVHTTIRDSAKERPLRVQLGDTGGRLKVFQADLMSDAGWAEACAGCTHVAHVASPIQTTPPKHEDDMIVPAREGVLRALRFAKAAGVTRFVQTSSMAAVAYGRPRGVHTLTEADWTNLDSPDVYPYVKSKTIAERAARDWIAAEGAGIEFVSVNPGMVLGPVESADFSASVEAIKQLLDGSMPLAPDLGFALVDNRDIADLHVKCLETPGLAGERFLAAGPFMKMLEVGAVLRARLGDKARKVPTRRMPDWMVTVLGLFNPGVRSIKSELGKVRQIGTTHAQDRLGWTMRPAEQTIVDCAESLIERGVVKI